MQLFCTLLVVLLLFQDAFANSDSACSNLAKATCEGDDTKASNKALGDLQDRIRVRFSDRAIQEMKPLAPESVNVFVESIHNRAIGLAPITYHRPPKLQELYEKTTDEETLKAIDQNQEKVDRLSTLFKDVQQALVEKIDREVRGPAREAMIQRIQTIKLDNSMCRSPRLPAAYYMNVSAFYMMSDHAFAFCPKTLISNASDAQHSFILGHELCHSIDPCIAGLAVGQSTKEPQKEIINYETRSQDADDLSYEKRLEKFPFANVLSCLRKPESSAVQSPGPENENGAVDNQKFYDLLCGNDGINESFCDWIGSEISPGVLHKHHKEMHPKEAAGSLQRSSPLSARSEDEILIGMQQLNEEQME